MKKIYLNRDKRAYTLVDNENYDWLNQWTWMLNSTGYAYRQEYVGKGKYQTIFLHRELVMAPRPIQVDHINRQKLDNRMSNLRPVTSRENILNRSLQKNNSSGYPGVKRQNSKTNPWRVIAKKYGKEYFVGVFKTKEEGWKAKLEFIESMGG